MPNYNSEPIFQLIKSLTKAEKRNFKLYATRLKSSEDAKFIKLFDLIDKQKDYDEGKLAARDDIFKPSQLPNLKAHLYKQILQSLRLGNSTGDLGMRIREMLDNCTILYDKCLYKQCHKVLEKAKQLAEKYEKTLLLLEIIEFEKKLVTKLIHSSIEVKVNELIRESEQNREKLDSLLSYSNLVTRLYSFYLKIGFIRNEKDFEVINSFFETSLPIFKEEQLSFDEKVYLYNSYVGYFFFIQKFEKGYQYAIKWVMLFDENPSMIIPKIEMYIKGINNLLMAQSKLGKYLEFIETSRKFDTITSIEDLYVTDNIALTLFKYASTHRINKYFLLGEFSEGVKVIPEIEKGLNHFKDRLDTHIILIFYYKFACMYFGNDQYKEAVYWLNQIINTKDVDLRSDIQCFARILNLISHYELENTDLVDYYIRSTYRFLNKKEDLHLYQNYIMKFLKQLNVITPDQLTDAFVTLRKQMVQLTRSPYDKRAFIYFDIISWLESKIENRPVQEIIKEKAQKRIKAERVKG